MPRLLERSIKSVDQRLILLAPPRKPVPSVFGKVERSLNEHIERLREVQRLRGSIYRDDGAVATCELSRDGLHRTPEDEKGWHLLMTNNQGKVSACVWYIEHHQAPQANSLRVRNSPPALRRESKDIFWKAVESDLSMARRENLRYAEIGGWAVAKESRYTTEGLILALAAFSFGRMFGGALGMTTATVRHSSSEILRRLGGSHLKADGVTVAPYDDPQYGCQMEVLRFDSRQPSAKYSGVIEMLKEQLANVLVIAQTASVKRLPLPAVSSPFEMEKASNRATA
jgi:hypothetical protein